MLGAGSAGVRRRGSYGPKGAATRADVLPGRAAVSSVTIDTHGAPDPPEPECQATGKFAVIFNGA